MFFIRFKCILNFKHFYFTEIGCFDPEWVLKIGRNNQWNINSVQNGICILKKTSTDIFYSNESGEHSSVQQMNPSKFYLRDNIFRKKMESKSTTTTDIPNNFPINSTLKAHSITSSTSSILSTPKISWFSYTSVTCTFHFII